MATYNHSGQLVTDLERAKRFYQEVLGFRFWYELVPPEDAVAKLSSLKSPVALTAVYLILDGLVLELLHYGAKGAVSAYRPRAMNDPGLTHLSFSVDNIHATAQKAIEYGGEIIAESDIGFAIFIRDPEGQLVELLPAAHRDALPPKPR